MNDRPEIIQKMSESFELADWIADQIDGLQVSTTGKDHFAAACFHVALGHHVSIARLIESDQPASALALLRPQAEAYLRGIWLHHFATGEVAASFINGRDLKASQAIKDMESVEGFDDTLQKIKAQIWSDLCDFTHCGGKTIRSHFSEGELRANFATPYLIDAMTSADAWALTTAHSYAILSRRIDLSIVFLERASLLKKATR